MNVTDRRTDTGPQQRTRLRIASRGNKKVEGALFDHGLHLVLITTSDLLSFRACNSIMKHDNVKCNFLFCFNFTQYIGILMLLCRCQTFQRPCEKALFMILHGSVLAYACRSEKI